MVIKSKCCCCTLACPVCSDEPAYLLDLQAVIDGVVIDPANPVWTDPPYNPFGAGAGCTYCCTDLDGTYALTLGGGGSDCITDGAYGLCTPDEYDTYVDGWYQIACYTDTSCNENDGDTGCRWGATIGIDGFGSWWGLCFGFLKVKATSDGAWQLAAFCSLNNLYDGNRGYQIKVVNPTGLHIDCATLEIVFDDWTNTSEFGYGNCALPASITIERI